MSKAQEVREEMARKLAEAEREDTIRAALDAAGLPSPRFVHHTTLYGTVATISYGDSYARYNTPGMTLADALTLAEKLPGVPLVMVRDVCLSFMSAAHVESLPEADKERWASETQVCPVLAKIEALHGPQLTLEWTTDLPDVGLVRVTCHFSTLPPTVATYSARRINYMGGFRYDAPLTRLADQVYSITDQSGEIVAEVQHPIRWASGGPEYPRPVTYYWVDVHTEGRTTAADIIRAMQPKE
jgi:hypothetical protein